MHGPQRPSQGLLSMRSSSPNTIATRLGPYFGGVWKHLGMRDCGANHSPDRGKWDLAPIPFGSGFGWANGPPLSLPVSPLSPTHTTVQVGSPDDRTTCRTHVGGKTRVQAHQERTMRRSERTRRSLETLAKGMEGGRRRKKKERRRRRSETPRNGENVAWTLLPRGRWAADATNAA